MNEYVELMDLKDDFRFGDVKVMQHKDNLLSRVVMKKIQFKEEQKFKKILKRAEKRFQMQDDNNLKLLEMEGNDKELEIVLYYQYFDDCLEVKQLKDEEILFLFEDITNALIHLKKQEISHGDVRPQYITCDQNKIYYLIDRKELKNSILTDQKKNIDKYKHLYMSPELFKEIQTRKFSSYENFAKEDLFSLGFLCLEKFEERTVLQEFYDFDNNCFDFVEFDKKIELICKRNVSEKTKDFFHFLQNFILVKRESRIDVNEAYEKIQQIQQGQYKERQGGALQLDDNVQELNSEQIKKNLHDYYNPLDFLNQKQDVSNNEIDNNLNQDSLIQLNSNMMINQYAENNDLFVLTKENDQENFQTDTQDTLEPLKYFNLKLKNLEPLQQNQLDECGKFAKSNQEDIRGYFESIGVNVQDESVQETDLIVKKLRDTIQREERESSQGLDSIQQTSNVDKQKQKDSFTKKKKKTQSLRKFLKNSSFKKSDLPNTQIIEIDNFYNGSDVYQKQKQKKSITGISKNFSIVKQQSFNLNKKKKKKQDKKSARTLIMNNFNILGQQKLKFQQRNDEIINKIQIDDINNDKPIEDVGQKRGTYNLDEMNIYLQKRDSDAQEREQEQIRKDSIKKYSQQSGTLSYKSKQSLQSENSNSNQNNNKNFIQQKYQQLKLYQQKDREIKLQPVNSYKQKVIKEEDRNQKQLLQQNQQNNKQTNQNNHIDYKKQFTYPQRQTFPDLQNKKQDNYRRSEDVNQNNKTVNQLYKQVNPYDKYSNKINQQQDKYSNKQHFYNKQKNEDFKNKQIIYTKQNSHNYQTEQKINNKQTNNDYQSEQKQQDNIKNTIGSKIYNKQLSNYQNKQNIRSKDQPSSYQIKQKLLRQQLTNNNKIKPQQNINTQNKYLQKNNNYKHNNQIYNKYNNEINNRQQTTSQTKQQQNKPQPHNKQETTKNIKQIDQLIKKLQFYQQKNTTTKNPQQQNNRTNQIKQKYQSSQKIQRSSNFINCYTDQFVQDHVKKVPKSTKNINTRNVYNVNNIQERESWTVKQNNFNEDIFCKKMNKNMHLYENSDNVYNKYQPLVKKTINTSIDNTNNIQQRQSSKWINTNFPKKPSNYSSYRQMSNNYQQYKKFQLFSVKNFNNFSILNFGSKYFCYS